MIGQRFFVERAFDQARNPWAVGDKIPMARKGDRRTYTAEVVTAVTVGDTKTARLELEIVEVSS